MNGVHASTQFVFEVSVHLSRVLDDHVALKHKEFTEEGPVKL